MPALNPREIVDVKDDPVIDPVTKTGTRIDPTTQQISEPMRRAVTYRDGTVEYFEWDKRGEQPPGPVPWGKQLPTIGVNQPIQNDWERAQKEPTGRGTEGGAPYITLGGQRFDPTTNEFIDIPGYRGAQAQGSWQGPMYYGPPGAPIPEALTSNPIALQQAQAQEQRLAAAEARQAQQAAETARQNAFQNQLAAIKAAEAANEIDAKRAQELRDYLYKTQVELPQKLQEQEDIRRHAGIEYGRQAGAAAVSDVTAMLPYRYSPGFGERRSAALEAAGRGDYRPQPIARGYVGPDLRATRMGAESQYRNQYLQQFGFDPQVVANQVGYRQPGVGVAASPAGGSVAPAPMPSSDDEEYLKQLARQLAGG